MPSDDRATLTNMVDDENGAIGYLFIIQPVAQYGEFFIVRGTALIGTGPATHIQLHGAGIASIHARIRREYDRRNGASVFGVYDFDRAEPVTVNGYAVQDRTILRENDRIAVGGYVFVFKLLL
jgi:hypothetical protein